MPFLLTSCARIGSHPMGKSEIINYARFMLFCPSNDENYSRSAAAAPPMIVESIIELAANYSLHNGRISLSSVYLIRNFFCFSLLFFL